jgi:hypothetical protein
VEENMRAEAALRRTEEELLRREVMMVYRVKDMDARRTRRKKFFDE